MEGMKGDDEELEGDDSVTGMRETRVEGLDDASDDGDEGEGLDKEDDLDYESVIDRDLILKVGLQDVASRLVTSTV